MAQSAESLMTKNPQESMRAADIVRAETEAIRALWVETAGREIESLPGPQNLILHDALPAILEDVVATPTPSDSEESSEAEEEDSLKFCDASSLGVGTGVVSQVLQEFAILRRVVSARLQERGLGDSVIDEITRRLELHGLETAVVLLGHLQEKETVDLGTAGHDVRNQLFVAAGNLFLLKSTGPENYEMLLERLKANVASTLHLVERAMPTPKSS